MRIHRLMALFCLLAVLCFSTAASAQESAPITVTALTEAPAVYEKFEAQIDPGITVDNPYDPAVIQVDVAFTAPSGTVLVTPAFYYHDFTWNAPGLTPTDDLSWRVRFTPQEAGEYRYRVSVTHDGATTQSDESVFTAAPSDHPGFVRVDARNPRYFAFDDGTPYFPIGLNIGWSTGDTISDYTTWLDALAAGGGNFIRVWMAPWDMSIEWIDTGLGNYALRQGNAYELDQVVRLAEERGIYIMLSLINHGQFNTTVNPQWNENPYNSANGGPCSTPECFATDPEAIRFWEQRVRYIVARWGYSPNIMTWEWWNEINWTPLSNPAILGPWIARNSALIRELDPYDHLLTHSGSLLEVSDVWTPLDFTQDHFYDRDDFPRTFRTANIAWAEAYPDKPFLPGEFGRATEALSYDREGVELHLGIWGAVMTGASGTAMSWWWDTYIHPNGLWEPLYGGISRFMAGEDMGARTWGEPNTDYIERIPARVFGLQASDAALIWLVSREYSSVGLENGYLDNLRARVDDPFNIEFPEIGPGVLAINALDPGTYTIEIWNTFTGEVIDTQTAEAVDGSVQVTVPAFNRDLALKIRPA